MIAKGYNIKMIIKRYKLEKIKNEKIKTGSSNNTKKKKTDSSFIHYYMTHTAAESSEAF